MNSGNDIEAALSTASPLSANGSSEVYQTHHTSTAQTLQSRLTASVTMSRDQRNTNFFAGCMYMVIAIIIIIILSACVAFTEGNAKYEEGNEDRRMAVSGGWMFSDN
jgi:hypothetical protein